MTDSSSLNNIINLCLPDEIYNLAAQSHVGVSFEQPEYTANVDALGTLRILEIIKNLRKKRIKFYQAGTSELFGKVQDIPQTEKTKFYPRSPYAASKLFSHWITINYRRLMIYSHVMAFCLIMKVQEEERHLLQKKLLKD